MDSGATCHMTLEVLDFIPDSLEDMDKHIEVADIYHVMTKQKVQVQIKNFDDNRYPFISTLHSVLLTPDLCDGLFPIITLINLGHTCLLQTNKIALCTLEQERKMGLNYHIVHKGNINFWRRIK